MGPVRFRVLPSLHGSPSILGRVVSSDAERLHVTRKGMAHEHVMIFSAVMVLVFAIGPGCSLQLLDQVASHGPPEQALAWEAVSEACGQALPQRLVQGLRQFPSSPASQGAQPVADLVREDPSRWAVLCPAGSRAFASSAYQGDAKGRRYDVCGWKALALGSREEFQRASAPELAVLAFHALVHDGQVDLPRARLFARAIGGLSEPPPPSERQPGPSRERLSAPVRTGSRAADRPPARGR